jgi:CheY-like chemotaxis protein
MPHQPFASDRKRNNSGLRLSPEHRYIRHILLMDDADTIREVAGMFLASMGYAVLEARDGLEALQICADALECDIPISGAFLDLQVADGMGGKEAIVGLREMYPEMPAFAMSDFPNDPAMKTPEIYRFTASISKPLKRFELIALVSSHIAVAVK